MVEEALERLWGGHETAICISSDLSHFLSQPAARGRDDATRAKIERGEWSELQPADACGYSALRGAIRLALSRGMRTTGIAFATSDEAGGPRDRVVGYGAFAFEEADAARLAEADRARLLAIAAASLEFAAAHEGEAPEIGSTQTSRRPCRPSAPASSRSSATATCAAASARRPPARASPTTSRPMRSLPASATRASRRCDRTSSTG